MVALLLILLASVSLWASYFVESSLSQFLVFDTVFCLAVGGFGYQFFKGLDALCALYEARQKRITAARARAKVEAWEQERSQQLPLDLKEA